MPITLVVQHPALGVARYDVHGEADVGFSGADISIPLADVDARHARFLVRRDRVIVVDLGARTGVFVGGARITSPRVLAETDVVTIGGATIRQERTPGATFAPRAPREAELLAHLAEDATRQIYGDWLEENGYAAEAEVLAVERAIGRADQIANETERDRLGYRLRAAAVKVPLPWRALVARSPIEGCERRDCPGAWDRLAPSQDPLVRWCWTCKHAAYFAGSLAIAETHLRRGRRAALDIVIERRPHDLRGAPAAPRPFFESKEPPRTVGELTTALGITPPAALGQDDSMGMLTLNAPTAEIEFFSVRYDWDMFHENPRSRWAEVASVSYESFTASFRSGADAFETWLEQHFGRPRSVAQGGGACAIYGHFVHWPSGALEWYRELPDWALAPSNTEIALAFLRELAAMLRAGGSHADLEDLGSRPPAGSGVAVTGALNEGDFWLELKPALPILDVARALEIPDPVGLSTDVHRSSWRVEGRAGRWQLEVGLDGRPSGEDVPNAFGRKSLLASDLARTVCIRRPR